MAVYQSLSVTQKSQNTENNTSQVRVLWKSVQTGSSYNLVEHTARWYVSVNDEAEKEYTLTYVLPQQTEQVILDTVLTVPHRENGEASVAVRTDMNTYLSVGTIQLAQTLIPDTIPRASTLQASDGVIGGTARLAIHKQCSGYSHSIMWRFGELQGYVGESGEALEEEVCFRGDSVAFQIPETFYSQIPAAKSGLCTFTICTYSDQVQVGEAQKAEITVSVNEEICRPAISGSVVDINPVTVSLTGDERVIVRHCSQAQCALTATGKWGATIVSNFIQGQLAEDGTRLIYDPDTDHVSFLAQDSRGFFGDFTESYTLIPYVKLTCNTSAERDSAASDTAVLYISGDYYSGSFGLTDNSLTVSYLSQTGETVHVEPTITRDHKYYATITLEGMRYDRVYNLTVTVSDKLATVVNQTVLKKSTPVFDWGEEDFSFHVPVRMDPPLSIANGGTGGSSAVAAWENLGLSPKMLPWEEYRTCGYWQGKPVYTKLITFGTMPNNAVAECAHNTMATRILQCRGSMSDGRVLPWGGIHTPGAALYCDCAKVYIDAGSDFSGCTALVQLYYIKE